MNNIQLHPRTLVRRTYRRDITERDYQSSMGVAAMCMCINDLLTGICVQTANVIKATPLYRHKVKQLTNALIKARQKYDLSTMAMYKRDGITVLDFSTLRMTNSRKMSSYSDCR